MSIDTGASLSSLPHQRDTAGTSLAGILFPRTTVLQDNVDYATIVPSQGSRITCEHCNRVVLTLKGDCLIITDKHDKQWHKSVVPLSDLGLARVSVEQGKYPI